MSSRILDIKAFEELLPRDPETFEEWLDQYMTRVVLPFFEEIYLDTAMEVKRRLSIQQAFKDTIEQKKIQYGFVDKLVRLNVLIESRKEINRE